MTHMSGSMSRLTSNPDLTPHPALLLAPLLAFFSKCPDKSHVIATHGITMQLGHALRSLPHNIDTTLVNEIGAREQREIFFRLQQCSELARITSFLDSNGINTLVLKGRATEPLWYPTLVYRSSADIDLLISSDDFPKVFSLCDIPAPHSTKEYAHLFHRNGVAIDLHHSLQEDYLGTPPQWDELWNARQRVSTAYGSFYTLSLNHHFLSLVIHGSKHQWARLKWVMDLVLFFSDKSLEEISYLVDICERYGAKRHALVALGVSAPFLLADKRGELEPLLHRDSVAHALSLSFLDDLVRPRIGVHHKIGNMVRYARLSSSPVQALKYMTGRVWAGVWNLSKRE